MKNNPFSDIVSVFHERTSPEEGYTVGYSVQIYIQRLHYRSYCRGCALRMQRLCIMLVLVELGTMLLICPLLPCKPVQDD